MVQTGPNTQFGGEKTGLFKVAYQVGIAEKVKNDPKIPAPKQSPMESKNFGILVDIILTVPLLNS